MPLDQAAGYLSGVPGIDALVAAIPGPALDLQTPLDATRLATSAGLATTSGPRATASQQAALLTALVASVPSALWRIPIDIDVSLQRQAFSVHADGGVALREPRWLGHMWGVLNLEGSLREWGQSLSVDHAEISTDSKPLQDL
jgi:hypothetical protein